MGKGIEEKEGDRMIYEVFRDEYCCHARGYRSFGKDEPPVLGCTYRNGKAAERWADWQKCTEENCPFMKILEGGADERKLSLP